MGHGLELLQQPLGLVLQAARFMAYIKLQQITLIHVLSIVEATNVHYVAFKASEKLATCSCYNDYVTREKNVIVLDVVSACSSTKKC